MRLIRIATMDLEEFIGDDIPNYAILSHTWGKEEISFAEFNKPDIRGKDGFKKIMQCCRLASYRGHDFIWIDTCCIDKSSSAELSEAINSMYDWYWEANECLAYLSDVQKEPLKQEWLPRFKASRWFTRGWTLQELLVPQDLIFYDCNWIELGTKLQLAEHIESITNIQRYNLVHNPRDASIAQRMHWASGRQTTRAEDIAYCLLGLFDINMPLLYGERDKAFTRLQQEIIRNSDDESIFAWVNDDYVSGGILAKSPADFSQSGDIVEARFNAFSDRASYSFLNRGLQFEVIGWTRHFFQAHDPVVLQVPQCEQPDYIAPIRCARRGERDKLLALHFQRIFSPSARVVQRVCLNRLDSVYQDQWPQKTTFTINVTQTFTSASELTYCLDPETRPIIGLRLTEMNWRRE